MSQDASVVPSWVKNTLDELERNGYIESTRTVLENSPDTKWLIENNIAQLDESENRIVPVPIAT